MLHASSTIAAPADIVPNDDGPSPDPVETRTTAIPEVTEDPLCGFSTTFGAQTSLSQFMGRLV